MAEFHLGSWSDPALRKRQLRRMRGSNAEWDLMGRTFLVLALGNMALREPAKAPRYLRVIDQIIEDTLAVERERGMYHFLMDYARGRSFVAQPTRSLFIDGEIALMLGARLIVADKPGYRPVLRQRVDLVVERMSRPPGLCAESYPDECWTFCNSIAVAAVRVADVVLGSDHRQFIESWLGGVRRELLDDSTGLLISRFDLKGRKMEGPEGSSIWMVVHCLQLVDEPFARQQYRRAKHELAGRIFGMGFAREWPAGHRGHRDIDSGVVIPLLGASPGASGLALVAAAAFGDASYLKELIGSLNFAGFPLHEGRKLRYAASNQVGDAVMLYAMVLGPLWKRVKDLTTRAERNEAPR